MKLTWKVYLLLFFVVLSSVLFSTLFPTESIFKVIYSTPGIIALLGVLYRLFLDETQYQKTLSLQHDQQIYELGATTHMADVVFDRHVNFCEEYMKATQNSIETLFREGPSPTSLELARNLLQIRINHATWLTKDIESNLEPFEQALRTIGADSNFYRTDPSEANSQGAVNEMYKTFKNVLSINDNLNSSDVDPKIATSTIIKNIRDILKIEELTNIRHYLISMKNHSS